MKPFLFLRIVSVLLLVLNIHFLFAGNGSIMGRVTDPNTKQPVADATVILDCQGNQTSFSTNEKGYYYASNITPCNYTVIVSFMSNKTIIKDIKVASDEVRQIDAELASVQELNAQPVEIVRKRERIPLLNTMDPTAAGLTKEDIGKAPINNTHEAVGLIGSGIVEENGTYYVRGAREDGLVYLIDGCRVTGDSNIPLCGVELIRAYTDFLPAKYGDTTGGVIVIESRSIFTE